MQTRPTNLVLAELHQGVYRTNTICAYIYYGSVEDPMDHEGNVIYQFMDNDKRLALEEHCKKTIAPLIVSGLKNTDYKYLEIDYLNMAPHPHLVLSRKDENEIAKTDIETLKNHLTNIIVNINQNTCLPACHNDAFKSHAVLFKKQNLALAERTACENDLTNNNRFV